MAGHDVVRSIDELSGGAGDAAVFEFDNKPTGMKGSGIVRALANVTATYPGGFACEMVVLNGYRW